MNVYRKYRWLREHKKKQKSDEAQVLPIQPDVHCKFPRSFEIFIGTGFNEDRSVLYGLREPGEEPFRAFTGHRGWGKRLITLHSSIGSNSSPVAFSHLEKSWTSKGFLTLPGHHKSEDGTQDIVFERHGGWKRDIYRYEVEVNNDFGCETYEWRSDPKQKQLLLATLFRNPGDQGEGEAVAVWREADALEEGKLGDLQLESEHAGMTEACTLAAVVSVLTICHLRLMAKKNIDEIIEQCGKVAGNSASLEPGF